LKNCWLAAATKSAAAIQYIDQHKLSPRCRQYMSLIQQTQHAAAARAHPTHRMALLNGDRSGWPPVKMVASLHTTSPLKHTSSAAITLRPTGCTRGTRHKADRRTHIQRALHEHRVLC
jgi:hypothetical protein